MTTFANVLWVPMRFILGLAARAVFHCTQHLMPSYCRRFVRFYSRFSTMYPRWVGALRKRPLVRLDDGIVMYCSLEGSLQRTVFCDGVWEAAETQVLHRVLQPGDVFVDIGAHVGWFTLQASRLVGEHGLVVAVEPSYSNLQRLLENLCANRSGNVLLYSCALQDRAQPRRLYQADAWNTGLTSLRPRSGGETFLVPCHRLDEVVPLELWGRIKLVKIDVEGAELMVLKGMGKILSTPRPPMVLCEVNDGFMRELGGGSWQELVGYMSGVNYIPFVRRAEAGETFKWEPVRGDAFPSPGKGANVLFIRECAEVCALVNNLSV